MDAQKFASLQKKLPDMVEYGIRAFHEMKEVGEVLREIDGMLSDVLDRKREGHLASVHVILKRLWVRACQEKKESAAKFAHELEEYLRYRRPGIELARSIIQSVLHGAQRYGNKDSIPHTLSAMRRCSLKKVFESSAFRLAA